MLILSPTWLFLYPGLAVFLTGLVLIGTLMTRPVEILGVPLGLSVVLFGGLLMFTGFQAALFGVFGLVLYSQGGRPSTRSRLTRFFLRSFTVDRGLALGGLVVLLGVVLAAITIRLLLRVAAPASIDPAVTRLSIVSTFVMLIGIQMTAFAFFLGLADLSKTLE
jgi:hypothetical protein